MNINLIEDKVLFIDKAADYIIANFYQNLDQLKVLMPNGISCFFLQRKLVEKLGAALLPAIVPISDVTLESEEAFNIPSTEVYAPGALEEKLWLAEIICSCQKLSYHLKQALRIAPKLGNFFYELEANDIPLEAIRELPALEQPEHWF